MAAPTSTNEVTARRLTRLLVGSDGNGGLWKKVGDKVTNAIGALDVASVGGAGKYISAISETNGKISATATSMDTAPTASSTNAVTSGGVKTALDSKVSSIKHNDATVTSTSGSVDIGYHPVTKVANSTGTVQQLIQELRTCVGGCSGSANVAASTVGSVSISPAWYHYTYIPHRMGSTTRADDQRNGVLMLFSFFSADNTYIVEGKDLDGNSPVYTAYRIAHDSDVVHLAGNESIPGRKTFTGMVENFNAGNVGYGKLVLPHGSMGTKYVDWDSSLKDGAHFREWTIAFPTGVNFWGRLRISISGQYYNRNSSGWLSKSIVCAFNTKSVYNNTGYYDDLGIHAEEEFRISDLIWDNTNARWTIKIHSIYPQSNNAPLCPIIEYWTSNTGDRDGVRQINWVSNVCSIVTDTTYYTKRTGDASSTPGTGGEEFSWATTPVLQGPYGDRIQYNWYGVCSTAAATAAKTVTVPGTFVLEAGAVAIVTFTNANTASTPTLSVNGTTAKNIFVNGAQITTNSSIYTRLTGTVMFIYDGTQYNLIGNFYNSTYNFNGAAFYSGSSSNAEHNANNISANGVYYWSSNGPTTTIGWTPKTSGGTDTDGAIYAQAHSAPWVGQIAQDYRNGNLAVRGKNNGTWTPWNRIVDQQAFASGTG